MADSVYSVKTYAPKAGESYTLETLAASKGYNLDTLRKLNPNIKGSDITIGTGNRVLTEVDSIVSKTSTADAFITQTYTIEAKPENDEDLKKYVNTFNEIAKMLKESEDYDNTTAEDLAKLNPYVVSTQNLSSGSMYNKDIEPGTIIVTTVKDANAANVGNLVTITRFGLQADTTRTLEVAWTWWDTESTENYEVQWSWLDSNGIWHPDSKSTVDVDTAYATYNVDEKALAARVKVKPIATSGLLTGAKWTGEWTSEDDYTYHFNVNLATTPTGLTFEIDKYKLTAYLDGIVSTSDICPRCGSDNINKKINGTAMCNDCAYPWEPEIYKTYVQFEITQDHSVVYNTSMLLEASTGYVSYSCDIEPGHNYKVRCRSYRNEIYSAWSDYANVQNAMPTAPGNVEVMVTSETGIYIRWSKVNSAESYRLQYVIKDPEQYGDLTDQDYFDKANTSKSEETVTANTVHNSYTDYAEYSVGNLATGDEYLMRISAINDSAESDWSEIVTFILGTKPSTPTTWSSTTTAVVGEPMALYWVHNSEDASNETYANIKLKLDGVEQPLINIAKVTNPENENETSHYEIDTSAYPDGSKITWQVQTAGVLTDAETGEPVYGDFSIERTINIYAAPTVTVSVADTDKTVLTNPLKVTKFPFYIQASVGNTTNQKPTSYYVSIISSEQYTVIDDVGNNVNVAEGTKIYSKYFDTNETTLEVPITASDITLMNNVTYTIDVTVSMSSGLNANNSQNKFKVSWKSTGSMPFAEIGYDKDTVSAYIRPYIVNNADTLLSVYRREFDGTFTEIATDLKSGDNTYVVDPHPALDYARYRIVSKDTTTGAIAFNDVPGYKIHETSIIIQWDEAWAAFEFTSEDELKSKPAWTGSMVKLPYNIDVSNSHSQDVTHVKYIGRKRPVSYYGTQLGETASWTTEIPKSDKETLYMLRRLAIWMGDVYVREPSGSGYWANIKVSFSQTHLNLTIPVTINVTPVEGGK